MNGNYTFILFKLITLNFDLFVNIITAFFFQAINLFTNTGCVKSLEAVKYLENGTINSTFLNSLGCYL